MTTATTRKALRFNRKLKPRWDGRLRELWVGRLLVKRFRNPAGNQTLILASFEEAGWPAVIDDPLPPTADIDPVTRLQFTVQRLNGCQRAKAIEFFGIGLGQSIGWRYVAA
jgi:hypothetical protein